MLHAKVTALYNEGALPDTRYIGAEGLAIIVDVDGERTLFDLGRRGRYLEHNMSQMGVKADDFTRVVISHGHLDHCGGLKSFLDARTRPVPIYAPASAWGHKGLLHPIGLYAPVELADRAERHDVDSWTKLSAHLLVSPPLAFEGGEECFLLIQAATGPVIICGCAHPGVQKFIDEAKARCGVGPQAFVGGLHIGKKHDKLADEYAHAFDDAGVRRLYLNHCTAVEGMGRIRFNLGADGADDFYVGQTVEFEV